MHTLQLLTGQIAIPACPVPLLQMKEKEREAARKGALASDAVLVECANCVLAVRGLLLQCIDSAYSGKDRTYLRSNVKELLAFCTNVSAIISNPSCISPAVVDAPDVFVVLLRRAVDDLGILSHYSSLIINLDTDVPMLVVSALTDALQRLVTISFSATPLSLSLFHRSILIRSILSTIQQWALRCEVILPQFHLAEAVFSACDIVMALAQPNPAAHINRQLTTKPTIALIQFSSANYAASGANAPSVRSSGGFSLFGRGKGDSSDRQAANDKDDTNCVLDGTSPVWTGRKRGTDLRPYALLSEVIREKKKEEEMTSAGASGENANLEAESGYERLYEESISCSTDEKEKHAPSSASSSPASSSTECALPPPPKTVAPTPPAASSFMTLTTTTTGGSSSALPNPFANAQQRQRGSAALRTVSFGMGSALGPAASLASATKTPLASSSTSALEPPSVPSPLPSPSFGAPAQPGTTTLFQYPPSPHTTTAGDEVVAKARLTQNASMASLASSLSSFVSSLADTNILLSDSFSTIDALSAKIIAMTVLGRGREYSPFESSEWADSQLDTDTRLQLHKSSEADKENENDSEGKEGVVTSEGEPRNPRTLWFALGDECIISVIDLPIAAPALVPSSVTADSLSQPISHVTRVVLRDCTGKHVWDFSPVYFDSIASSLSADQAEGISSTSTDEESNLLAPASIASALSPPYCTSPVPETMSSPNRSAVSSPAPMPLPAASNAQTAFSLPPELKDTPTAEECELCPESELVLPEQPEYVPNEEAAEEDGGAEKKKQKSTSASSSLPSPFVVGGLKMSGSKSGLRTVAFGASPFRKGDPSLKTAAKEKEASLSASAENDAEGDMSYELMLEKLRERGRGAGLKEEGEKEQEGEEGKEREEDEGEPVDPQAMLIEETAHRHPAADIKCPRLGQKKLIHVLGNAIIHDTAQIKQFIDTNKLKLGRRLGVFSQPLFRQTPLSRTRALLSQLHIIDISIEGSLTLLSSSEKSKNLRLSSTTTTSDSTAVVARSAKEEGNAAVAQLLCRHIDSISVRPEREIAVWMLCDADVDDDAGVIKPKRMNELLRLKRASDERRDEDEESEEDSACAVTEEFCAFVAGLGRVLDPKTHIGYKGTPLWTSTWPATSASVGLRPDAAQCVYPSRVVYACDPAMEAVFQVCQFISVDETEARKWEKKEGSTKDEVDEEKRRANDSSLKEQLLRKPRVAIVWWEGQRTYKPSYLAPMEYAVQIVITPHPTTLPYYNETSHKQTAIPIAHHLFAISIHTNLPPPSPTNTLLRSSLSVSGSSSLPLSSEICNTLAPLSISPLFHGAIVPPHLLPTLVRDTAISAAAALDSNAGRHPLTDPNAIRLTAISKAIQLLSPSENVQKKKEHSEEDAIRSYYTPLFCPV